MGNCLLEDVTLQQQQGSKSSQNGGLLKKIFRRFKEPQEGCQIQDPKVVKSTYTFWRISIFASIYVLYFVSYLCRKNLSPSMSPMSKELGISSTTLGILISIGYVTYGIGKFVNGMLADKSSVRKLLPFTIIAASIAGAGVAISPSLIAGKHIFGISPTTSTVILMAFFWGLSGWLSSAAFPLCGKSLTFWFSNKERSVKWSWWSTSHEFGASAGVLIAAPIILSYGWRWAFYIPAIISIVIGCIAFNTLRDKPKSIGLPDIEDYHHTEKRVEVIKEEQQEENESYWVILKKHIFSSKDMWLLGAAFIFVYILRIGPLDWLVKYFVDANNDSVIGAATKACIVPLVGSVGTLSIPYVSEKIFKGRRAPANFCYLLLGAASLLALRFKVDIISSIQPIIAHIGMTGHQFSTIFEFTILALIGISTCGPLVLIGGLCSVEASSKKVAAAATGFTGSAGYLGAVFAASISGYLDHHYGINAMIVYWMFAALAAALLCIPLWNKRSRLS